jgi:hypothetical protein
MYGLPFWWILGSFICRDLALCCPRDAGKTKQLSYGIEANYWSLGCIVFKLELVYGEVPVSPALVSKVLSDSSRSIVHD